VRKGVNLMINENILEKVDRINQRLAWLDGISELMRAIDHDTGTGPVLDNVGWLISSLTGDVKEDVDFIWRSLGGNVEEGGVKNVSL